MKASRFSSSETPQALSTKTFCPTLSHHSSISDKFKITERNPFSPTMVSWDTTEPTSLTLSRAASPQAQVPPTSRCLSREKASESQEIHWPKQMIIASIFKITWIWNLKLILERWSPGPRALTKLESDLKEVNKKRWKWGTRREDKTCLSTHTFKRKKRCHPKRYHTRVRNSRRRTPRMCINNLTNTTRSLTSSTREPASAWWQSSISYSSNHSRRSGLTKRRRMLWPTSCSHSPLSTSKGYLFNYHHPFSKNLLLF